MHWRVAFRPSTQRIIERFAATCCPPDIRAPGRSEQLLDELQQYLAVLPAYLRRSLIVGFIAFDQGARLYGPARGRRFVDLDDRRANAYFRAVAGGRSELARRVVKLIKAIVIMCYYELPAVKAQLAYAPDAYIAMVARRRIESYADAIRAGEAAVYADEPVQPPERERDTL